MSDALAVPVVIDRIKDEFGLNDKEVKVRSDSSGEYDCTLFDKDKNKVEKIKSEQVHDMTWHYLNALLFEPGGTVITTRDSAQKRFCKIFEPLYEPERFEVKPEKKFGLLVDDD